MDWTFASRRGGTWGEGEERGEEQRRRRRMRDINGLVLCNNIRVCVLE